MNAAADTEAARTGILDALCRAAAEVPAVPKTAVEGLRYAVRSWDDIASAVSGPFQRNGLVLATDDGEPRFDADQVLIRVEIAVHHVSGETIAGVAWGSAPVRLTNPIGAARTFALREWIARLLMIPFGDAAPEATVEAAAPPDGMERRRSWLADELRSLDDDEKLYIKEWASEQGIEWRIHRWADDDITRIAAKMDEVTAPPAEDGEDGG